MVSIKDRNKDIISGGENISSVEVKDVLFDHPDIGSVAVIGVPSERWGETPKAIAVQKADAELTAEDVIEYAAENLAHYKCPTSVEFVEALPETAIGKCRNTNFGTNMPVRKSNPNETSQSTDGS